MENNLSESYEPIDENIEYEYFEDQKGLKSTLRVSNFSDF